MGDYGRAASGLLLEDCLAPQPRASAHGWPGRTQLLRRGPHYLVPGRRTPPAACRPACAGSAKLHAAAGGQVSSGQGQCGDTGSGRAGPREGWAGLGLWRGGTLRRGWSVGGGEAGSVGRGGTSRKMGWGLVCGEGGGTLRRGWSMGRAEAGSVGRGGTGTNGAGRGDRVGRGQ